MSNPFRAVKNRIIFLPHRARLQQCGNHVVMEGPFVLQGHKYISLGSNIRFKPRLQLEAFAKLNGQTFSPSLTIGDNVSVNYDVHIGCINKVSIGNGVLIASKVFISDHSHGDTSPETVKLPPSQRPLYSKGPVIIEDNVWIGEGAAILPGVTVGQNSIIGANAVVTHDIPPYSVAVGVPARVVKTLNQ